jgi:SWI/SNF-related matrix-associated actin-dependent regulator of chromatin subfamily A3
MAPSQKRSFEPLDYTEDSPYNFSTNASSSQSYAQSSQSSPYGRAPKQPRTSSSSTANRAPSGATQQDPVYIDSEDDEEEDVTATQGYSAHESSWMLYGVMHGKIVGVRYYNGYATVGEMVVVRREPNNAYDRKDSRAIFGSII